MTDRFTIKILVVGEIRTNCYIMQNRETGAALIVDPGDGAEKIAQILERFSGTIGKDVLADTIDTGKMAGYEKDWNINGEHVTLGVEKIS